MMMKKLQVLLILVFGFLSVKSQSEYRVMFSSNYPPYNFIADNGELVGFNIDLLEAISRLYNVKLDIKSGSWNEINRALNSGEIDAIAGAHYPGVPDVDNIYTRSTINTAHCLMYNSHSHKFFSLEEFRTLKEPLVALWENDIIIRYIESINPTTKFLFVRDYGALVESIKKDEVTCAFALKVRTLYQAEKMGVDYLGTLDHQILERNMGFKVSINSPEFARILNNGLEVILANGEYQIIYDKWIAPYDQPNHNWSHYLHYSLIGASISILLLLILLLINRILKTKIQRKTADLQKQLDLNSEIMRELNEQKIRAEESDKMKTAFLANMSHEIRTPMNGILGFTDLLRSVDYSSEEQQQFIEIIEQSGKRMLDTINNIIAVSKIESGLEKPIYTQVDVKKIVTELFQFFSPEAELKNIDIQLFDKSIKACENFNTDEYKLNSILTNLIKNAIKFTKKGSVTISFFINSSMAEFWVSDTGVGIEREKQEAVFDEFVQADFSNSSGYEGSGLGLSISKGYVYLLNGKIELESELGKGTTFHLTIPNHVN